MVTDTERAWHTFALHPNALSWRFYESHLQAYGIDRRIELLKDAGEWPPVVHLAKRWHDIGELLRFTEPPAVVDRYAITLDTRTNRLAIADARVTR